jgi:hypothetical protein
VFISGGLLIYIFIHNHKVKKYNKSIEISKQYFIKKQAKESISKALKSKKIPQKELVATIEISKETLKTFDNEEVINITEEDFIGDDTLVIDDNDFLTIINETPHDEEEDGVGLEEVVLDMEREGLLGPTPEKEIEEKVGDNETTLESDISEALDKMFEEPIGDISPSNVSISGLEDNSSEDITLEEDEISFPELSEDNVVVKEAPSLEELLQKQLDDFFSEKKGETK